MDEIMKNVILNFTLFIYNFLIAQSWHTFHTNVFHPYSNWTSHGFPHKQFKINPYDNSIWFASQTKIFRLSSDGQFTDFNASNEPMLQGYYAFEDIAFTPSRTVLVDQYFGLINYDGNSWSTIPNGVNGIQLSSDLDTIWCARINENYSVIQPQGVQLGNSSDLRRIESKNGNHWASTSISQGGLSYFQNGTPLMYNADTIPFMLENQTYLFKFSRFSDTLYKSGDLGIALAVGNSFVDTITPNNTINMPTNLIIKEFEIDHNHNIWALFGEAGILSPTKKLGYLDRALHTWTIYDEQNTPIIFTEGAGIELDTLGNLWVVNKQLLHVFTTGIEPAWLGTSELANDNSSIVIYPNPTKNELHIQNNGLNVELIEIRDINGKVVMSLTSLENISLENLDAGMYFVQVKFDKDNLVQQKLIKE
jgi:hypothetical protein